MNKKELVEAMAGAADISKAAAEKALNGMLMAVTGGTIQCLFAASLTKESGGT